MFGLLFVTDKNLEVQGDLVCMSFLCSDSEEISIKQQRDGLFIAQPYLPHHVPSVFPETYWDNNAYYRCLLCIKGPVVLSSKAALNGCLSNDHTTAVHKYRQGGKWPDAQGKEESKHFLTPYNFENNFSPKIYLLICKTTSLSVVHNINSHKWPMSRRAGLKSLFCPDRREKLV